MSILRRTEVPLIVTGIVTGIVLIDLFSGNASVRAISTVLQQWSIILAGFALGIGAVNLLWRHGNEIRTRKSNVWYKSAIVFFFILVMMITGLIDLNLANPVFRFTLDNIYARLYAGVWAFEGFFGVYGYYRAFKVRGFESAIMFVASVIITLKNAPLGEAILGPGFIALGQWVMDIPNVAGIRALTVSAAIGTLILALRSLLGKERAYLKRS
jgi:hypothetical protein